MSALHLAIASPYLLPYLVPSLAGPFGGSERQLAGLARGLAARGHRVDLVCLDLGGHVPDTWTGGRIFRTFREGQGIRGLRFFYPRLVSLWRALARSGAPIVLTRSASGEAGLTCLEASLRGRRTVLSIASDRDLAAHLDAALNARDRALYQHALRRADLVIAQTVSQSAAFERLYGGSRLRRIPSWVEIPPQAKVSRGEHFLFVGGFRPAKRPDVFVDLAASMPELRFLVLGGPGSEDDRSRFDEARRRARSLPNLELRGFVRPSEVAETMSGAIALVNTSDPDSEGFPNAFLEAWACGVPVVSLHVDPDELLCSRGLGVHARTIEGLVDTLRRLADVPTEAAEMGGRAREYCRTTHDVATVVASWEAALSELDLRRAARVG